MTDLLLFRHAKAHDATPEAIEALGADEADAQRELTRKGRARFEALVNELVVAGVEVEVVLHSPWRRAVETAELLGPLCTRLEQVPALAEPPGAALDAALANDSRGAVAVVGHQPWMGELLARLTGAPVDLVRWKKGGLVWLQREGGGDPWQIVEVRRTPRRG